MGRSATKSAVPPVAPELQTHQTHGARAGRSPERSGSTAVIQGSAGVTPASVSVPAAANFTVFQASSVVMAANKLISARTPRSTCETHALPGIIRVIRVIRGRFYGSLQSRTILPELPDFISSMASL